MLSTDLIADMIRLEQARRLRDAALVRRRHTAVCGEETAMAASPAVLGRRRRRMGGHRSA